MATNVFGTNAIEPGQPSYRKINLTSNINLFWPTSFFDTSDVVALLMEITQSGAGYSIGMPDATAVGVGSAVIFNNIGAESFSVISFTGSEIATIPSGSIIFLYLTDNTTQSGTWSLFTLGGGTSIPDATALAGLGLIALLGKLNTNIPVRIISTAYGIQASDRAALFVWEGGTDTIILPSPSSVGNGFYISINNQSQTLGLLSVMPTGGTIDFRDQISLAPSQSSYLITDGSNWFSLAGTQTPGTGVSVNAKNVGGNTDITLSAPEAARLIQEYSGTLTGNISVMAPLLPANYYVSNFTLGSFTLSFTLTTLGSNTYIVPQGSRMIFFCDGVNIYNAESSIQLSPGTVSQPTLNWIGDTSTGLSHPSTNTMAVSLGGSQTVNFSLPQTQFLNQIGAQAGSAASPSYAYIGDSHSGTFESGVDSIGVSLGGIQKQNWTPTQSQFLNQVSLINGTSASPSAVSASDATSGIYFDAPGSVSISTATTQAANFTSTQSQFYNQVVIGPGSALAPTLVFSGDNDSGLFQSSVGNVSFSADGIQALNLAPALSQFYNQVAGQGGSAGFPSYVSNLDYGTGMYFPSANITGFSCNGTQTVNLTLDQSQFFNSVGSFPGSASVPSYSFNSNPDSGLYDDPTDGFSVSYHGVKTFSSLDGGANISIFPWGTSAGNTGELRFLELAANGIDYVSIKSPDILASSFSLILPDALPPSSQAVFCSTGGQLSFGSVASAPVTSRYLLQIPDVSLPNAQSMSALSTGIVKNTTTTGVQTIAVAGTDYVLPSAVPSPSAKYLIQTSDATVPSAQVMGSLATGLVKNTTTTGIQSIAVAGTDYVAPSAVPSLFYATVPFTPLSLPTFTTGSPLSIQLTPSAGLLALLVSGGAGYLMTDSSCNITVATLLANASVSVQLYTNIVASPQAINTLQYSIGGTSGGGIEGAVSLSSLSGIGTTQLFLQFSTTSAVTFSLQSISSMINFLYFPAGRS